MTFEENYKNLNPAQKEAVDTVEGPVMVIAGPGTGKTQILTLRIANILKKTQTEPENILAITYTEAGVVAMRKRLANVIGPAAYRVAIRTFHGFANSIIMDHPEDFSRIIGSRSITDVDQIRIIEELLEQGKKLKLLRPFGDRFHYLGDIKNAIQKLKREGVSPESYKELVAAEIKNFEKRDDVYHDKGRYKGKMKGEFVTYKKKLDKNLELTSLYATYQDYLDKNRFYDYDDMIMETLRAFKENPELLLVLQEQYQYVLVDEHQDTNNVQNRLLESLMSYHDVPNLFMVGDEKQAIFRFQGASLENFHYFKERFPSARLITLTENYRSSQTILDAAASISAGEGGLKSNTGKGRPIHTRVYNSSDLEMYGLAQSIKEDIKQGVAPEEISVLYRTNKEGPPLESFLKKMEVPCRLESDQDILFDPDVRKLVMIFSAINQFGRPEMFVPLMYLDIFNIDPLYIYKLTSAARKLDKTVMELVTEAEDDQPAKKLYSLLAQWKKTEANRGLLELFDSVMQDSGLLASILKRGDAHDALDMVNVFLEQIRRFLFANPDSSLSGFMDHLMRMKEHGLAIRGGVRQHGAKAVRLMNAHRAKGLEFDLVYIINCADRVWGNRWSAEKLPLLSKIYALNGEASENSEDSDERNLFYVALTRARKEVTISYARENMDQREQLPSRFIGEIRPELVKEDSVEDNEAAFKANRSIIYSPAKVKPGFDKSAIKEIFMERGFAVTHLNNYLECPWKYFFLNLLLIPKIQDKTALYGIAVHKALEDVFRARVEGTPPAKNFLLERFKFHTERLPFATGDMEESLERGLLALGQYFENYSETWVGKIIPELKIAGIPLTDEIVLTGNLDRLDVKDDNHTVVTDYKTGRPKSRNEIEGNTRNADGNIKRQLVFYKLLLDRYEGGKKFIMDAARVDFIQPDDSGKFKNEVFHIQDEEVKELEELIKEKADEIMNLKFWNNFCDNKDCEFCGLRKMLAE